jgi:hypothetical protein
MDQITVAERDHVRALARQVAEIAAEPRMEAIRRRWRDVNALRKPDRAPVWCRPVGCWKELLPEETLVCRDPWLREVERGLRQVLAKRDIDDDTPVEPTFDVPAFFDVDPPNVWGVDVARHRPDDTEGAWAYDPPLKSPEDDARLRLPTYTYNPRRTEQALERAHDVLGDILPVRSVCHAPLHAALDSHAGSLRGLQEMMLDTVLDPERLHRLMAHLRDGILGALDQFEAAGLVTPNNEGPMYCSDPLASPDVDGRHTFRSSWCAASSQEFDTVSPAGWREFLLEYQLPVLARFGLSSYGCCENLTKKIDGVLSIPNLRIFVCSAWTNLEVLLERVGPEYCIMWRQKASDVVLPHDTETIRRDLDEGLRRLQGRPHQIVLRELQTLAGHPDRLHVWTRLAKDLAARHA